MGHWVSTQRKYYKYRLEGNAGAGASITEESIASIHEEAGFDEKGWQHKFQMLCEFLRDNLYNHNKPPPAAPTFPAGSSVCTGAAVGGPAEIAPVGVLFVVWATPSFIATPTCLDDEVARRGSVQ